MTYEFRVVPHSILPGKQAVECWRDGVFVAGIYPHFDGIRIVSKFMTDVWEETEPARAQGSWLPAAFVKLGEKPVELYMKEEEPPPIDYPPGTNAGLP